MPIIEFAYLELPPPVTSSTPALLKNLKEVKSVIESESHDTTSFFKDVQDQHRMYVIGGWPSQAAHQSGFDGSAKQAQIIDLIKDQMSITWMNYFDIPYARTPGQDSKKLLCAVVFEFHSFGQNSSQERKSVEDHLQTAVEDQESTKSWNLKKSSDDEDDVFVLWRAWEEQEEDVVRRWASSVQEMLVGDQRVKKSSFRLMRMCDVS